MTCRSQSDTDDDYDYDNYKVYDYDPKSGKLSAVGEQLSDDESVPVPATDKNGNRVYYYR